jgi:hypothetical protein
MIQATIWAYKAFSQPHIANKALTYDDALSGFYGDFRGFMGLRFICLSSALPFAEKEEGKMKCVSVMEEKAENAVKVIKAVVFQLRSSETAERTRAD